MLIFSKTMQDTETKISLSLFFVGAANFQRPGQQIAQYNMWFMFYVTIELLIFILQLWTKFPY